MAILASVDQFTAHADAGPPVLRAGPLAVREDAAEAWLGDAPMPLTHAQRRVLKVLLERGRVVTRRDELYEAAFGRSLRPRSRAIDTHIARIRRALGPLGPCIVTVGSVGYRLDVEALEAAAGGRPLPTRV